MVEISSTINLNLYDSLFGNLLITNSNGVILYTNKAIEKRTGYSVAEVVGKRPGDLWGGNMSRKFYSDFWDNIRDKKTPYIIDVLNNKKDGTKKREKLHVAPIFSVEGGIKYYIEIQPDYNKKSEKENFHKEFLSLFSNQNQHGVNLLEWVFCSLSRSDSGRDRVREHIKNAKMEKESLSGYLYGSFVFPIKSRFKLRSEDKQLILAAKNDPKEFWLIYQKYREYVLNYFSCRLVGRSDIAEELMQDTFLKALKYISTFTITNASYRTYLLRIAHNLLVNYYRQTKMVSLDDIPENFFTCEDNTVDIWDCERLIYARSLLGEVEQAIFRMKYDEGMKIREIAVVLQKSENAVKLHLSRGRKKLKDILGDYYGSPRGASLASRFTF